MSEEWFVVQTEWGSFRLDCGAYRDYLEGKLWISRTPAQRDPAALPAAPAESEPSAEAVRMREAAARRGAYELLRELYPGEQAPIPFRRRMGETRIDEMPLSFRASNALKRAGVGGFGQLVALMRDRGLRTVRNIGVTTEREIVRRFFESCYARLSPAEQSRYWQELLDARN